MIIVDHNHILYVYDEESSYALATYNIGTYNELSFKLKDLKEISVYKDGIIATTIAIT